jgi:hypothetical protein
MKHCMIDLETVDSGPNAAILSIGACIFDPSSDVLASSFYTRISIPDQLANYERAQSANTMKWWEDQTEEARKVFYEPAYDVEYALIQFTKYLTNDYTNDDVCVWGNGVGFDNVILRNLFTASRFPVPWKFYNDRDYRTIKNLLLPREYVKPEFVGTPHYAVDDAIHQAKNLQAIFKVLKLTI